MAMAAGYVAIAVHCPWSCHGTQRDRHQQHDDIHVAGLRTDIPHAQRTWRQSCLHVGSVQQI